MTASAGRKYVVDIDDDPLAERARRRRTLTRIGLPLGGVGLIIGFLLGIAIFADRANRAGVLGLSDTLLHGLQDRIALQVSAYLEPASRATMFAHGMVGRGGATIHTEEAYAFAASVLNETPQAANILFADDAGDFMLVRRAIGSGDHPPLPGSTETKHILVSPEGRKVEWITRDKAGAVIARREDPTDTYDPRTRSWFIGAKSTNHVFWSGVYIFFSERTPGVTAAARGSDDDPDIAGVDIKLDALSNFLGQLSIGKTGRAYIVSKSGEMIAGPEAGRILREQNGQLSPARIADVGDANLSGSWDHFRVDGAGSRVIEVGGEQLISIVTPLANDGQDWLLIITVPEVEFSGFVTANSRRVILRSLIVVALAAGLGVLLVRQGLRADSADRAVAERSEAVRQQSEAFARLTAATGQFQIDGPPPSTLTETLAAATGARRAGVWRLLGGGQILRCEDSFEPDVGGHVAGVELSRQEVPALIEAFRQGEEIDATDARRDRRTATFHGLLMAPLGSMSLFAVPIMQSEPKSEAGGPLQTLGVVLLEDARRDPAARDIARACAALVALRMPADTATPRDRVAATQHALDKEPASDERGLDSALLAQPLDRFAGTTGTVASVLMLRLPEAAIARLGDGGTSTLADRIASTARDIGSANGIPYLKMMGAVIVAASGLSASNNAAMSDAASRLADVAISLRELCSDLLESSEDEADFSLGLDAGPVLGGVLCAGEATPNSAAFFNLWGEAFRGAESLAGSAPAGTIQASEQSFQLLRKTFLFRPRGLFHRPGIGEARSYLLAGRA